MHQNSPVRYKSNKAFMILSALGILFVVDAHSGVGIGFFSSVFPYDSFFMPMFMFISGYFWKEQTAASWTGLYADLKKKFGKLMVPYLAWAGFYALVLLAVNSLGMGWPRPSLREFVYSLLTDGTTFSLNGAAWFVPTLFFVTAAYSVLRRLLGHRWNDTAAMLVFAVVGCITVALTKRPGGVYVKALHLYKLGFFIQFFQLGQFFKHRLEKWFDSANTLGLCLTLAAVNLLLLGVYGDISFGRCAVMSDFASDNPLLPLITSVTGTFFWLKIAKRLSPVLGDSPMVNYISGNTFFIMMHHVLFLNVFSAILWSGKGLGIPVLSAFDAAAFRADPWYRYVPNDWLGAAYFLFGISAAVLACKLWDRALQGMKDLRRRSMLPQ